MLEPKVNCAACCAVNRSQQIWCIQCDAPLLLPKQTSNDPGLRSPEPTIDSRSASRVRLYEEVIDDLQDLLRDQSVRSQACVWIEEFYRERLAAIESKRIADQRARAVNALKVNARRAAHENQFPQAIALLNQALAIASQRQPIEDAITEIKAWQSATVRRQQEAEAARCKAETLRREAADLLSMSRLGEAEQKLNAARELDQDCPLVTAMLTDVKTRIKQHRNRETERTQRNESQTAEELTSSARQATTLLPALKHQSQPERARTTPNRSNSQPATLSTIGNAVGESRKTSEPRQANLLDDADLLPTPTQRLIETTSKWSSVVKPFLLDNVGWFVGAFLIVAGFVILVTSFWTSIAPNRVLVHSLVYLCLAVATVAFFALAYFMRRKYPRLESSSNALLVIVALLIPLVFAAAVLTSLVPVASIDSSEVNAPHPPALQTLPLSDLALHPWANR